MMRLSFSAVCFVVWIGIAVPSILGEEKDRKPEPKVKVATKDLVGRWESDIKLPNPYAWMSFGEDGMLAMRTRIDNGNHYSRGGFKLEGNEIVFTGKEGLKFNSTFVILEYRPGFLLLKPKDGKIRVHPTNAYLVRCKA